MHLDKEAAAAVSSAISATRWVSTEQAAWGIHLVATSNMENALRLVSVERGRDPRRYAMVAFGGAGPLHAARLARAVGIPQSSSRMAPASAPPSACCRPSHASMSRYQGYALDAKQSGRDIAGDLQGTRNAGDADVKRIRRTARRNGPATRRCAMRARLRDSCRSPAGPDRRQLWQKAIDAFKKAYLRKHKFLDPEGAVEAVDWTLVATMPSRAVEQRPACNELRRSRDVALRRAWFPEPADSPTHDGGPQRARERRHN